MEELRLPSLTRLSPNYSQRASFLSVDSCRLFYAFNKKSNKKKNVSLEAARGKVGIEETFIKASDSFWNFPPPQ